jgi:hypothetical protein
VRWFYVMMTSRWRWVLHTINEVGPLTEVAIVVSFFTCARRMEEKAGLYSLVGLPHPTLTNERGRRVVILQHQDARQRCMGRSVCDESSKWGKIADCGDTCHAICLRMLYALLSRHELADQTAQLQRNMRAGAWRYISPTRDMKMSKDG